MKLRIMSRKQSSFRSTTKVNQKDKVGLLTSGLLLLLIPGFLAFFTVIYFFNSGWWGLLAWAFVTIILLSSGGLDPYKFVRELANTPKKKKWRWGRKRNKSIFRKD